MELMFGHQDRKGWPLIPYLSSLSTLSLHFLLSRARELDWKFLDYDWMSPDPGFVAFLLSTNLCWIRKTPIIELPIKDTRREL